jgi:hypothetical protein
MKPEEHYDELAIKKKTGVEHIPSTKELLKSVICEHDEVILAYLYGSAVQTCSRRSEYGFNQQFNYMGDLFFYGDKCGIWSRKKESR